MWKIVNNLFLPSQYIPHGHCYLWQSPLVGLHVVSDLLIAIAYFSITLMLLHIVYQRNDTLFPRVFVLFGAFILLCGTGHLLEIWTLWQPAYWLSGIEKFLTALVSCYTALQLIELLPQLLALRTSKELEAINHELQTQIRVSAFAHQELQRSEQTLQAIVAGTASVIGEAFFSALAQNLATALDVPYVLVSEVISQQPQTLKTIAFWSKEQIGENFVYEMTGTPCGSVVDQAGLCHYPGQVQESFPTANLLKVLCADSYVGAPLLNEEQQVIGVLCIVSDRPLSSEENAKAMIKVFAARAEVELLRQRAESALYQAYDELELRVQSRTSKLVVINTALTDEIQERIAAETALQQQAKREQLISNITQHIRKSLNLQEILNTTVAEVRQLLQINRVVIYRFNPDWGGAVVVESVEVGWMPILGMTIQDDCFVETYVPLYQQGRTKTTDDIRIAGLAPCHMDLLTRLQVKANLVVPILQGETLWGLLIAHHCDGPRHWQDWETNLLNQLATQLAIAIQQSELFERVQKMNTELEQQVQERTAQLQQSLVLESALKRITDKVRDSLDESQILHTVVEELIQILHVDCCNTALYDLEQGTSTTWYEQGRLPRSGQDRAAQMPDFPDVYPQLLQGQYLQFCQRTSDPSFSIPQRRAAILICPICDDQGVSGDLWLSHEESLVFNELEIRLVQQVANQCAIALRQARLYQVAQTQVEELEKLNRLKDDFLSTVSHELRTPMSSIKMATHMLEVALGQAGLLGRGTSTITRYFKILQDECQREIGLINDLLDLTRLDAGSEPVMLTTIDPHIWIPCIAEPFVERALNQQQQLQLNLVPNLPLLTTDLTCMGQVVTELLHNACKYTPAGERIVVSTAVTAGEWQLSVSNTGVKLSASECVHIFDKFYRIPNNDPWKHGGTGLGLALVKKRVERLGAMIYVKSDDEWLTFTIKLPIEPSLDKNNHEFTSTD